MTVQNVNALIQERNNQFIETRAVIEIEVNKFLTSLGNLDQEEQVKVGYKPGITCRDVLPELWEDNFREDVYQAQLNSLLNYIGSVRSVYDQWNVEALACLQS